MKKACPEQAFLFSRVVRLIILFTFILPASALCQFNLQGDASSLGADCIQLTPWIQSQQGAAWHVDQLDVSLPFCVHLTVNLGSNESGADGIAFVLQQLGSTASTTTNGGNMGYGDFNQLTGTFGPPTFDPSLVIEFDTWNNGAVFGDPTYDHIALQRDGTTNHNGPDCLAGPIAASATSNNIEDGQDHVVHIEWNPSSQSLRCDFDGVERFNATVDMVGDVLPETASFGGVHGQYWWGRQ